MPAIAKKARLSVRNWHEYNESLVGRGSITIWFSEEALANWYHENGVSKRGRPFMYSDSTMELFLMVRELLRLPGARFARVGRRSRLPASWSRSKAKAWVPRREPRPT